MVRYSDDEEFFDYTPPSRGRSEGSYGDPIFEGEYNPNTGWNNTRFTERTGQSWSSVRYVQPGMAYGEAPTLAPALENPWLRGLPEYVDASTDTDLILHPPLIWDVNGYYRLLGIAWMDYRTASIKQMRIFYMANGGPDDRRMTYALSQLRNRKTRSQYNATPFGQLFMDADVEEWLRQRALAEARRRQGADFDAEDGEAARDILKEWGFIAAENPAEGDAEDVDDDVIDADPAGELESSEEPHVPWAYSYYVWRSACDDTERLGRWQALLVAEFVRVGVKRRFAVGFMGRQPQEWVAGEVQNRLVAFLHQDIEPTEEMAAKMVASVDGSS